MIEDPKVEELAQEMVATVVAPTDDEKDIHHARVFKLVKELPRPKRQRAIKLGRALLAEHHAIERAGRYLNR